jgi:zinc D-Ala-D-Ala dipeptidase
MKSYRTIPIVECGEPLVPIPDGLFARFEPAPYLSMGASYGDASPWMLRTTVLEALTKAQKRLQSLRPGWKIMLFDAYRPNGVQVYMVEREFGIKARDAGLDPAHLTTTQREMLAEKVFTYWAPPSDNPATPPPHSTGAVMDITLADEYGHEVDMGSPIDEGAPPAAPDYFTHATDDAGRRAHANRVLLREVMCAEGFHQHPDEWWHFSRGDQYWAWLERQTGANLAAIALYGRADLL